MGETITIYIGLGKSGELKKKALHREAIRRGVSLSDMVWELAKKHGSEKLRRDLEAADLAEQRRLS